MFENYDEKPTTSFLYSLVMDPYALGYNATSFDMPLNQKVFLAAFDTIKKIADKGPCVIVGRCADYALKDYENKLNVFIHAPMAFKKHRINEQYNVPLEKTKDAAVKVDKQRARWRRIADGQQRTTGGEKREYRRKSDAGVQKVK